MFLYNQNQLHIFNSASSAGTAVTNKMCDFLPALVGFSETGFDRFGF
jgi:hypothetical protein